MPTLVLDPAPAAFAALLEQRRRWGADHHDEVWQGVRHMNPPASLGHQRIAQQLAVILDPLAIAADLIAVVQEFAIGVLEDYRVPDGGLHRPGVSGGAWHPTAALVIEIVSPRDETWAKLPFYAAHDVDELLIVDPTQRGVEWFALDGGAYRPISRSQLIELGSAQLGERLQWPSLNASE